jgi:glycosyltransferase involved in cell wall biosynthesis
MLRVQRLPTKMVCGVQGLHVTEVEDMGSAKSRFAAWVEKSASPLVDRYDCNSPGAVEFLAGLGISRDKLSYVPMGIEPADWPLANGAFDSDPVIFNLARFVPRKRHVDLVEALHALRSEGVQFTAVLAGDGPTRAATVQRAKDLELEGRVQFPGSLSPDEAKDMMNRAAVFCLPSTWEGTPTVVLEAMASGVPVVGTDVNGTADLVGHEETGLLVPPGNPEALARALGALLEDPESARRRALAARQRVETHYSVAVMVDEKLKMYEETLSVD